MRDICRDHEAVRVHLGHAVCPAALFGEGFTDTLESAREKVAMGTLAKERANFLIVEAPDYLYSARVSSGKTRGNECLYSGEGAELVIDTARKDKLFVQAAKLRGLSVEELELPIDDAAIWLISVTEIP